MIQTSGARFCLVVLVAWGTSPLRIAVAQDHERALSVEREVKRLTSQRKYWPGFDPLSIPLAVYTGAQTFLFRHPSPPEGFSPEAQPSGPAVFQGRHPSVTANTNAELGGVATATLLADGLGAGRGPTELAAIALHEAFHVFQRQRHPSWSGNEGDLFIYPTDDANLLRQRRLESAALRRALAASNAAGTACWARVAIDFRRERFAGMDSAFSTYERLTELNEGLANYVQLLASGPATVEIPAADFLATAVRGRAYAIGPAFAFLLDRLQPGWPAALEGDDKQFLDRMLGSALESVGPGPADGCALEADEVAGIGRVAQEDVAAVVAGRGERRRRFDTRPGWRVVVEAAEGQPLWPQGFDPLNIERVEGGFLHTRFLRLGNDAGELQAIDEAEADIEALTDGVGPHPLFNGVRRMVVAGLAKPAVVSDSRQVTVRVPGFTVEFRNATVQVIGTEVLVRLEPPR